MSESFRFCSRAVVESFHRAENFSVHQTQDRHPEKFVDHASNVDDVIRRRRRTQVRECDGVAPWRRSNVSLSAVGKFISIQFQCSNRVIRINGSVATWFFYLWAHVWCDWRSRLLITDNSPIYSRPPAAKSFTERHCFSTPHQSKKSSCITSYKPGLIRFSSCKLCHDQSGA